MVQYFLDGEFIEMLKKCKSIKPGWEEDEVVIHKQQGVTAEEMIESMGQDSPLILGHASSGVCVRGESSVGDFHSMASSDNYSVVDTIGCVGNKIITASGGYFDYVDPKPESICIRDIAKALANCCRFSGHCESYSVAEHSVRCMGLARKLYPDNNELAFAALMHDAAEAYVGDVPKPLKLLCPGYQQVERRVEKVIQEKYGISTEYHNEVKRIDLIMLKAEKAFLFPDCKDKWEGLDEIEDFDFHGFFMIPSMSDFDLFLHFFSVMQQVLKGETK